jgi:hypothetical protein
MAVTKTAVFNKGASNMMRTKTLLCGVVLASSAFILAGISAAAGAKKDTDKPALSGVWMLKMGDGTSHQTKIEFSDSKMKIFPHGSNQVIVVICEYTAAKGGLVKAKITDFEGKEKAIEKAKKLLPVGTDFSFMWDVKDDNAKLNDLKGDKVEHLKSHLEGDYSRKK